jgi:hypothetical protein
VKNKNNFKMYSSNILNSQLKIIKFVAKKGCQPEILRPGGKMRGLVEKKEP